MDHAIIPREQTTGEAPRLSPLEAFVQWIANFIRTITGMKRRKVFPKNWKDHWPGLREIEWGRDQILAFAAKHVLSGGSLNDHTDFQLILEVPDGYGICPCTAQAMNRRFIAMAQFRLNPDKYIFRHIRRIARAAGIALKTDTSGCPLRHARSSAHDGGGSRSSALIAQARGPPPYSRLPIPHCLARDSAARMPAIVRTRTHHISATRSTRTPHYACAICGTRCLAAALHP